MPVMNGFEFRAAQVKSRKLAAIPTVVVTATVRAELAPLGDVQVLTKPVELSDLLGGGGAVLRGAVTEKARSRK